MSFESLKLFPQLLQNIEEQGYEKPYPIQLEVIPKILAKEDVLGIAKTGSGKTASYVLPILTLLENVKTKNRFTNVLVVVPTRELAVQVQEVFYEFSKGLPFPAKSLAVFGGVAINPQMKRMRNVNVLVATPGRLLELTRSNAVNLSKVSTFVMDEADKLLNLGFRKELDEILRLLPKKRQNLLFSATLNSDVKDLERIMQDVPSILETEKIVIEEKEEDTSTPLNTSVSLITQTGYFVSKEKKGPLLRHLIKENKMEQVLVFTSSIYQADQLTIKLRKNGINSRAIHSKKSQGSRQESLTLFKNNKLTVLVTTDLLARGIDIEFLPFVVNYELPRSPKDFIHRIGRTGRAENPGEAITFVTEEDKHHFRVIQKKMKQWVTMIDSESGAFEF
ncbi:MAG: DEAD/DEAH box helicase [Fluviicola sp.]|nr:DEAD/DEAH box helicase [Fluviicola sp.]